MTTTIEAGQGAGASTSPKAGRVHFLELEDFRRSVNRRMWGAIGGLVIVALAALAVALVAFARPIPVVVLDGKGQPVLFEDTVTPRLRMEQTRIEYFASSFLKSFSAVDSTQVDEQLEAVANRMTPRLRRIFLSDEEEIARRKKHGKLNLKARFDKLEFKIGDFDPEASGGRIYVVAHGALTFRPKLGEAAEDESHQFVQYYYAQLVLQRVPVARESIHGLQVDYVDTEFFDTPEALEVFLLKEQDG